MQRCGSGRHRLTRDDTGGQPCTAAEVILSSQTRMTLDNDKIERAVLALLYLGLHDVDRAWKGFDWEVMNRLHEKGFVSDPRGKAKSVAFTERGLIEARRLLQELFSELRALTVNLIATELFRGKRARKERESGTPTGTVPWVSRPDRFDRIGLWCDHQI